MAKTSQCSPRRLTLSNESLNIVELRRPWSFEPSPLLFILAGEPCRSVIRDKWSEHHDAVRQYGCRRLVVHDISIAPRHVTRRVKDQGVAPPPTTAPISHTGQVLSRVVTFQFALDPNLEQRILFAKCAGARRYTVNHHLARVKANLDARSTEREILSERGDPCEPSTPSLSWTGFSFINEFNAWKNGQSDDSPVNEDGTGALPGVTNCPATSSSARAWTRPGPRELLGVETWRTQRNARRVPPLPGQGEGDAELSTAQPRNVSAGALEPAHPLHRSLTPATAEDRAGEALRTDPQGPPDDRRRSLPRVLGDADPARRSLDGVTDRRSGRVPPGRAQSHQPSRRPRRGRPRDHLPLRRCRRERCSLRELRGGENTEARTRVAQGGQPGPGQNHTGVQGSPTSEGPARQATSQGRQHPTTPRPPSLHGPGGPLPGTRDRGPQRRGNGEEPPLGEGDLRRRHGRTFPPAPLQGQIGTGSRFEWPTDSSRVPRRVRVVARSRTTSTCRLGPIRVDPAVWSSSATSTRQSTSRAGNPENRPP